MARLHLLERSPRGAAGRGHAGRRRASANNAGPLSLLTAPVIYLQALPLLLLDLFVTAYQWTCFPIYGIDRVPRGRYVWLDRHRLPYLNTLERLNCTYCGYANGVIAYVREVTARTEEYWCPIKHRRRIADEHRLYDGFYDYGDEAGYRRRPRRARRQ
jgi:hypothetical protein